MGGPDFFFLRRPRGDQNFFAHANGGGPRFFLRMQRGRGPEKNGDPQLQTPPGKKIVANVIRSGRVE